ncbi:alpha/beta-hydrolase [Corynespora cassiicola Philippines]|uniref:Alpha/beta-hydrolase n=1 Tax=Corynespora cassiicola Philippines TaxID=1448308 RepID=A0A2T2NWZ7_CORCC|nr:alpha/beta-hydrolase [Corynespora cassiicola Philippines]
MDPKLTHDTALPQDDLSAISYLAKPSGACCLEGNIHSGSPRGSFITIRDIETYTVQPLEPSQSDEPKVLLFFPDIWGMYPNSLLIMDGFADKGYTVLGVDYFRGDPVWKHRKHKSDKETEPGFDYDAWKEKHRAFADEAVPQWVQSVKEKYAKEKPGARFACVGYCFGAPYVCDQLSGEGASICEVGAFAHPAFLKEHHFRNLKRPLYLGCAETDFTFDTESRNRAVDIMHEVKAKYELQLFYGVEHGFAVRGDMEDRYERWVKERCFEGVTGWCDFWLGA